MIIVDPRKELLRFARTLIENKDCTFGSMEYVGNIQIGNDKKRACQFVKGKLALPYEAIIKEYKDNIAAMDKITNPIILIPKQFASEKLLDFRKYEEDKFKDYLKENPKIAEAMDNLLKVIQRNL